jgi:hypothetical protein
MGMYMWSTGATLVPMLAAITICDHTSIHIEIYVSFIVQKASILPLLLIQDI